MLNSRPFSFDHARPPEGKPFAADRLHHYSRANRPADTTDAKATLAQLEGSLARQKVRALTAADQIRVAKGEMALPDHIRAAGPIVARVADLAPHIANLKTIVGNADAHNESLASGLNQLATTGDDHA